MKRLKRKLKTSGGFTLAETLVAVLILLMVSSIVAAGVPAARTAYGNVVLASNSEVLLSTTISALRNELGTAGGIKQDTAGTTNLGLSYYNKTTGNSSRIFVTGGGAIQFQQYAETDLIGSKPGEAVDLISPETATEKLYATYSNVTYSNNIVTFTNLQINQTGGKQGLAKIGTFRIRVLSY